MSSAKGFQTVWLGIVPIPDLIGKDKAWGQTGLLLLIGLHVAAALKHHFINRDGVLQRMLHFLKR